MKTYIYISLLFLATIVCKAQSPIYNIDEPTLGKTPGSYFKDLNGDLDAYEGTYEYSNSYYDSVLETFVSTNLTIVLKKKILSYGYYYKDIIVGEFKIVRSGHEWINTLANINVNYTDEELNHAITGNRILTGTAYGCPTCSPTEKRLRLGLIYDSFPNVIGLDIRKNPAAHVNGYYQNSIFTFFVEETISAGGMNGSSPRASNFLPPGEYLMNKRSW